MEIPNRTVCAEICLQSDRAHCSKVDILILLLIVYNNALLAIAVLVGYLICRLIVLAHSVRELLIQDIANYLDRIA